MVQVFHQKETIAKLWKDFSHSSGGNRRLYGGKWFCFFSSGNFPRRKVNSMPSQNVISECNL
jgi:hypothetical protein